MSFQIHVWKNRTKDFDVQLYEADGVTEVILAPDDVVRLKIGRGTSAPILELSSFEILSGGSKVTFVPNTNDVTVRIGLDTSSISPGSYDAELIVIDNSESSPPDAPKHVEYGVFSLHTTPGGAIGEETSSSSSSNS